MSLKGDWKVPEYIEREEVYYSLMKQATIDGQPRAIRRAAKIVATFPASDVRPVAKAAWEQVEVRYEDELIDNPVQAVASMFCPNCQRYHNEVYFYGMPTERVNFCPNCGADMR
jgi:hypothetical protein